MNLLLNDPEVVAKAPPKRRPRQAPFVPRYPCVSRFVYAISTAVVPRAVTRAVRQLLTDADKQRTGNGRGGSRITPETASDLVFHL